MFEYEIQQMRHAELIREASAQRLAKEARKARRAARRSSDNVPEGPVNSLRNSFARAA